MAPVGRSADIEPMKPLRIILIALAVLIVGGTIASAATGGLHGKPTPSPSVSNTETEAPEPTETEAPEPTETEAPEAEDTTSDESGTAPNFSRCDGLTGLDNAICRHEALLKVKPDNPGLTNSLAHLEANLAAHAAKQAAKDAGTHGHSGTHGNSGSHGPSGS
jgi:pyruvate/2-oxoglutarate dehydrogenase complex dihydrolipoamide acyltransferase (E2) component